MLVWMSVGAYKWFAAYQIYDIHAVNAEHYTDSTMWHPAAISRAVEHFGHIRNRRVKNGRISSQAEPDI